MNLHGQIMNIQADPDKLKEMDQPTLLAYKEGHRDARHKAAELSLEYEARIEELEELVKEMESDYIIIHTERSDLFWSNEQGWVDRASADIFSYRETEELSLPFDGAWHVA